MNSLILDIGGTKTTTCILNGNDKPNILFKETFSTSSNPEHEIQKINSIYKTWNTSCEKISLSVPGMWNKEGLLKESFFLHEWLDFPFIKNLSSVLNIKETFFESDVICGGLGEYFFGCGRERNISSLLYVNLGTGIGASLIIDGKPFKSASGLTLRLQKMVLPFEEELYSAVDLICGGTLSHLSKYEKIEKLFEDYNKAEIEAVDVISRAQIQLASHLINLFYLFAPEVIVLNGGLTFDWGVLAEEAVSIAHEELENKVKIVPSVLKELAPVYGAYKLI